MKNKQIYLFIAGVSILGFLGIIIYSSIKNENVWVWMSASLVISLAAFFIGGLIGFLFGIPKFNTKYNPTEEREYLANTSLEQISEWLTKIIIGVGLTQLIVIPRSLKALSEQIVQGIVCKHNCPPEDTAFILSLI